MMNKIMNKKQNYKLMKMKKIILEEINNNQYKINKYNDDNR